MRIGSQLTGMINPRQPETSPVPNKGKKLLEIGGSKPFALYESDLSAKAKEELGKLGDATVKIEGIFVRDLLNKMMPKEFGGEGPMGDFTRDQFTNAISDIVGKNGSLGIAKMFKNQLSESIYRTEAARLLTQNEPAQTQETKP
jgi:Rod binding domain-containing protein